MSDMEIDKLIQWDKQYLWHPFTAMGNWLDSDPLVIERAQGIYLYDTKGNRYIDGVSSMWCNVHGHCHEHINEAIRKQLDKVAHSTLLGLAGTPSIELAQRLVDITPNGLDKVFYSDSGATAVEIALKFAFQYWRNTGHTQKQKFIALKQSYHGDTIGAMSLGGIELIHQIFESLTFDTFFSDHPHPYRFDGSKEKCRDYCLDQMEKLLTEHNQEIAAIVVEPLVQGAGGIIVHPPGFLKGLRKLATQYEVLLIADEVATGFGRTGTMFACEHENVQPDILCCGKGITGGYLPLAATLATEKIFNAFFDEPISQTTFYHGHTYTGNALGCAAGLASLEVFENEKTLEGLAQKSALIDKYLTRMAQMDFVGDVRSKGMMAGIELVEDKDLKKNFDPTKRIGAKLCQSLRSDGVLLRPLGDVIVIMPPLAITIEQLETLLTVVEQGLEKTLGKILSSP